MFPALSRDLSSFQVREGTESLFRSSGPQLRLERDDQVQVFPFYSRKAPISGCPSSLPFAYKVGSEMVPGNVHKLTLGLKDRSKTPMTLAMVRHHSSLVPRCHPATHQGPFLTLGILVQAPPSPLLLLVLSTSSSHRKKAWPRVVNCLLSSDSRQCILGPDATISWSSHLEATRRALLTSHLSPLPSSDPSTPVGSSSS